MSVSDPASMPTRQMGDPAFRAEQWSRRFDPHIAPVNRFVDSLKDVDGRGWLPYVAPLHAGVDARLLTLLRDPGPATQQDVGSGFLCVQNADPTAEQLARAFDSVRIHPHEYLPWNAYPWYINRAPKAAERAAGAAVLDDLLRLLPDLAVVLLLGNEAKAVWRRLERQPGNSAGRLDLEVVSTYHPGRQALFHPDPEERQRRMHDRENAYRATAAALRRRGGPR